MDTTVINERGLSTATDAYLVSFVVANCCAHSYGSSISSTASGMSSHTQHRSPARPRQVADRKRCPLTFSGWKRRSTYTSTTMLVDGATSAAAVVPVPIVVVKVAAEADTRRSSCSSRGDCDREQLDYHGHDPASESSAPSHACSSRMLSLSAADHLQRVLLLYGSAGRQRERVHEQREQLLERRRLARPATSRCLPVAAAESAAALVPARLSLRHLLERLEHKDAKLDQGAG